MKSKKPSGPRKNPKARVPVPKGHIRSTSYVDPHKYCKDHHGRITLIDKRDGSRKEFETCTPKDEKQVSAYARMYGLEVEGQDASQAQDH